MPEKATILVADDDPMARELIEEYLDGDELRVVTASTGRDALEKAAEIVPDLILLDVMMPGMDGFEACRRLRGDPRLAEVPIIMITALNDRKSRLSGLEAGADDFLSKPYDGAELQARVKTITRLDRYRRLLAERTKFDWVVESSEDGYLVLGDGDVIVDANPAARVYLGRMAEAKGPIHEPFRELASFQYRCEPVEAWADWPAACPTPRYLVRPETADSDSFWLRVELLDLPVQHDARHLVRLRDETSRVVLKRDMWKFSSLVSHKLRTPLTTILGGLEFLSEELQNVPKEELAEFIDMASDGARRLKDQVLQVLNSLSARDIARSTDEGFELASLESVAEETATSLELASFSAKVAALLHGRRLKLSPVAFELILRELLGNAKKFHPRTSPSVELTAAFEKAASFPGGTLKLTVGDDGMHVPAELLARVWAPYFQSEKGFSGSVDGMGLGLSVVASLVWGVDGSCRIYNQESGPGIVVELVIPLAG